MRLLLLLMYLFPLYIYKKLLKNLKCKQRNYILNKF